MKFISILVGVTTSRPTVILVHVLFFFNFQSGTVIMRERVLLLGTTEYVFLNVFSFTLFFLTKVRLGVEADIDIYIYIVLLMKQFLL